MEFFGLLKIYYFSLIFWRLNQEFRFFYVTKNSIYPFLIIFLFFGLFSSFLVFFKFGYNLFFFFCLFFFIFLLLIWVKDVFFEALIGNHSFFSQVGFNFVFLFFIFSEFILFFSMFWFFFDSVLVPSTDIGELWLPVGILSVNLFGGPFFNSVLLLLSGFFLTLSYQFFCFCFFEKKYYFFSIFLGFFFSVIQIIEYFMCFFTFSDRIFGSLFFFITGFHGLHVFFGLTFIVINFERLKKNFFSFIHHLSFEFVLIYWHFVDLVWLYLFFFVYFWGS